MTEYTTALLMTYVAFLFAVLSPGPNMLGILNIALERGRVAGVFMGFGIALGSLTWATLTVVGLTQFIAKNGYLLQLIKILGGLYLLYLAYMAFKSSGKELKVTPEVASQGVRSYFLRGYLLMMTNPKAALAWVAIVSLTTFSSGPLWLSVAAVSGTFSISVVVHTVFAIAFSNRTFVQQYSLYKSGLQKGFAVVYSGLGVKLLSSG